MCPVCDEVILDDSSQQKGQNSIFCDEDCNMWLDCGCAGLSKKAFLSLNGSVNPFYCVSCRLNIHSAEIQIL